MRRFLNDVECFLYWFLLVHTCIDDDASSAGSSSSVMKYFFINLETRSNTVSFSCCWRSSSEVKPPHSSINSARPASVFSMQSRPSTAVYMITWFSLSLFLSFEIRQKQSNNSLVVPEWSWLRDSQVTHIELEWRSWPQGVQLEQVCHLNKRF